MSVGLILAWSVGTEPRRLQIGADGHSSWVHCIHMDMSWSHCPFYAGLVGLLCQLAGCGCPWSGGEIAVGGRQSPRACPVQVVVGCSW
eukprot:973919-Prorocentrum_lima.AAC.1